MAILRPSKSEYHNYYGELAANPVVPTATNGDLYYNTVSNVLMGYINGVWVSLSGGVQESYAELYYSFGQCGSTGTVKSIGFTGVCSGNPVALTALTAGQVKGAPFVTVNAANGSITIGASGAGRYLVTVTVTISISVANIWTYFALRRNGAIPANVLNIQMGINNLATDIDPRYNPQAISGIVNAAAGDVFDIVLTTSNAGNVVRFWYVNFSMVRIGA
jgi:hypothetical protein